MERSARTRGILQTEVPGLAEERRRRWARPEQLRGSGGTLSERKTSTGWDGGQKSRLGLGGLRCSLGSQGEHPGVQLALGGGVQGEGSAASVLWRAAVVRSGSKASPDIMGMSSSRGADGGRARGQPDSGLGG